MTVRLAVDFGTSTTVAVLDRPGHEATSLLFDGSPLLPSAVFAPAAGELLVGQDAWRGARMAPARFEPNPKQRIDEGIVLLGDREVPVPELVAAVLSRIAGEARRVSGPVDELTMTVPVAWGRPRRAVLAAATDLADLPRPRLVPEPVAAAALFAAESVIGLGTCAVVYDFGAGTFDATVVRRHTDGIDVLASAGLPDVGGLNLDAAVLAHLGGTYGHRNPDAWARLIGPRTDDDRRATRQVWDDVRGAKELLSRTSSAFIPLPSLGVDAPLGREQLDELTGPILARTVHMTLAVIRETGVTVDAVLLVGGSSRIPAVATMLHRATGIAPTVTEWPELVVARGALQTPVPPDAEQEDRPRPHPGPDAGRTDPGPVPAATEPAPAGVVTGTRLSWRRPAALGAVAGGTALVGAVVTNSATRTAFAVGLSAPAPRPLFPLLAATVFVLGAGRFRRRRLLPLLPGDPPEPVVVAGVAFSAAIGWIFVQGAQAATLSLGFVTPEISQRLLIERAGPLTYPAVAIGVAAVIAGIWLVAGAVPPDPLEPPLDGQDAGRRSVAAAFAGAALALGAQTHLYGNRVDATTGEVVTARAADDPVLFLARTFSQPDNGALLQVALAGAYLLGVGGTMWLLCMAAAGVRRLTRGVVPAASRTGRAAGYVGGAGAGLLPVAGGYLAYHAYREIGYWSAWRPVAGVWAAPPPVNDPVLQAGGWLRGATGPVIATFVVSLAVIAMRPRKWPWPHRR